MKNLFIPYELAVIAKEKGFNEPCLSYYQPNLEGRVNQFFVSGDEPEIFEEASKIILAPLYQQIIDWFREKHDIHILPELLGKGYCWSVTKNSTKEFYPYTYDYNIGRDKTIEEAFKLI